MRAIERCETGSLGLSNGLSILLNRKLDALPMDCALEIHSADASLVHDIRSWVRLSGHRLVDARVVEGGSICLIERGSVKRIITWSTPDWNNHASIEEGIFDTRSLLIGAAARVPDRADVRAGLSPRGAVVEDGAPPYPFDVLDASNAWSPQASLFYDQASANHWNAATDIPWGGIGEVNPDVERAVCQIMTFLAENEFSALYVPARWIPRIHPHFLETILFLSTQVRDEARHIEAFTKRALLNGGGLQFSSASTQKSLQSLLDCNDFLEAGFLLGVLGEGTFLDLLRYIEIHAPDVVTQEIARRTRLDEARHVHFALSHIHHAISMNPLVKHRLSASVQERAAELDDVKALNPLVEESLVILASGGLAPERMPNGVSAVRDLHGLMHENRVKRLQTLGFSESEAVQLSSVHTPNFM